MICEIIIQCRLGNERPEMFRKSVDIPFLPGVGMTLGLGRFHHEFTVQSVSWREIEPNEILVELEPWHVKFTDEQYAQEARDEYVVNGLELITAGFEQWPEPSVAP